MRISMTVLVVFAIVTVFMVRLVDIQIVQADELNAQSFDKRAVPMDLYGTRGSIVDTNGNVLALSVDRFDITASPRVALSAASGELNGPAAEDIARVAALTGGDPAAMLADLMAEPDSDFMYLAQGVTLDVYNAVRELDIPWVNFELRQSRTYPNGAVAGNLVGFIGTDGPQEGLEVSENECLASENGTAVYEKGEDGVRIPGSLVTTDEPVDGGTLHLTIDRDLQWYVQERMAQTYNTLGASWVTAVVMRVSDGHLMAVVDYPSVDPNNVDDAPRDALGSRAFTSPYEPGSTMKAISAAELLDQGLANQTTPVTAPGRLYLSDGSFIKYSFPHDDLPYTLTGVIVDSSNTGISLLSSQIPAETRRDYLLDFGFNDATDVGFLYESEGVVLPTQDWDERTNLAVQFGQALSVTSVQMASAYQALANGGVHMPATLVEGCELPDGTMVDVPSGEGERVVSEAAADGVVEMLEKVVTEGGARHYIPIDGYRIAAKSGTAEVAVDGVYGNATVISFAGMAPAEDPEYVVLVTAGVPNTAVSSMDIATTFRDVIAQTLTHFRVQPSGEPAPEIPLYW
jgi:cell division protein FtsI (penicillin-binding protein 3)